ncbi:nuclear transport factor 2 family protein [Sphingomonas profundi]|uniref:nuclear transport factor 2 family protein n=1 Tax=Alterirhizorhabdus profundi TaxID=2681549 RepID=UPI0012E7FA77|nr:nuclear transport factor 2 family protein [Sphingomonas profundi]
MVRSPDEETVLALYAAGGAGDWNAAAALVTPDFTLREPECFPFGGTYLGIAALRAFYTVIFEAAGPTDMDLNAATSGDGHVTVLVTLRMRDHGVTADVVEAFRMEDGKIAAITVYYLDPPRVASVYAGVADAIASRFPDVQRLPAGL